MAQFCTKCGSQLGEGMTFCTACGAVSDGPSATAAPTQLAAGIPPLAVSGSAVPIGAAPAAKSGSPVLKIVLIVVAVLIFFSLLSAGACVYFVYRAKQRVSQFEKQVRTTFPAPTGTKQAPTQPGAPAEAPGTAPVLGMAPIADIGTLVYPGSTPAEGGGQLNLGVGGVKVQASTTSDSVDTVAAYYKAKLGSNAILNQTGGTTMVQLAGSNGFVTVTIVADQAPGKTKITVSSIGR
jgi:hypothetical protein